MMSAAQNISSAPSPRRITPLGSLRRHWKLAAAVALVVVAVGLPAAWFKGAPTYAAWSVMQVAPRYMKNLKDDNEFDFQSNSQYRQFVEHQVSSVRRYDVVRDAMARLGEQAEQWKRKDDNEQRTIMRLQEKLLVRAVPDTYLMEIRLEAGSKKALADTVNAISTTFIERMKQEMVYGSDERMGKLDEREHDLTTALTGKSDRRTAIAQKLGVATFVANDINPHDKLLTDLRHALHESSMRRVDAEAKAAAFARSGETDISIRSVQEHMLNDPGLNSLKAALSQRRAVLVQAQSGLKAEHPGALAAREEIRLIDAEIAQHAQLVSGQVRSSMGSRYSTTVDQARRYEEGLKKILAEQQAQSSVYAALFNEGLTLSADIAQLRGEIEKIRERSNFLTTEMGAPGFVRLVTPAMTPEYPFGPGRKKLFLMVLVAALGLALIVPIARDALDSRVRNAGDAERAMGFAAAGVVGIRGSAEAEDALRRIASALIQARHDHEHASFAMTSVVVGAGNSSLTLDLGRELDKIGFPTVVIEANAASPDARYASSLPGLQECLLGRADVAGCVSPADDKLPARISVGQVQGKHLSQLDTLASVMAELHEQYAFVLVDLPALGQSADAELLVRQIGRVMTVVPVNDASKAAVQRVKLRLARIDPESMGLVVVRA